MKTGLPDDKPACDNKKILLTAADGDLPPGGNPEEAATAKTEQIYEKKVSILGGGEFISPVV